MKLSTELITAAKTVFMAMAYTQSVREIVEPYQTELLAFWKFKVAPEWLEKRGAPDFDVITEHKHSYLMDDSDSQIYFKELHCKHLEHGFKVQMNYCPLLTAESLESDAKKVLLEMAEPMTGISGHKLLCAGLDKYKMAIELLLQLCAPYCNAKEISDSILKQA